MRRNKAELENFEGRFAPQLGQARKFKKIYMYRNKVKPEICKLNKISTEYENIYFKVIDIKKEHDLLQEKVKEHQRVISKGNDVLEARLCRVFKESDAHQK